MERDWRQKFESNLADLFSIPTNTFSTGEEFIVLSQREGIDNPITREPIIIEDSPENIII